MGVNHPHAIFSVMGQTDEALPRPVRKDYAPTMAPELRARLAQYHSEADEDEVVAQAAREMTTGNLAELGLDENSPFPTRAIVARALAKRCADFPGERGRCLEVLAKMAGSPDAGVRASVLNALVSLDMEASVRKILTTLSSDTNPGVRREALQALEDL